MFDWGRIGKRRVKRAAHILRGESVVAWHIVQGEKIPIYREGNEARLPYVKGGRLLLANGNEYTATQGHGWWLEDNTGFRIYFE